MKSNPMLCILLILFGLIVGMPATSYSEGNRFLTCSEEWCFLVAQPPSEWPSHTSKNTFPLEEIPGFSLRIPEGFEKIYRVRNLLIFSYRNKSASVTFEEISRKSLPELPNDDCMTVKDMGHAIFTKTPKDIKPGCDSNWQYVLYSKQVYFRKNVKVICSKKKNITSYFYTSRDKYDYLRIGGLAVVVNDNNNESFIVIRTVGIAEKEFYNIIGSIH